MSQATTSQRVLSFLGQQSAPPSLYGRGRRVLYECPTCHHPWLMEGPQALLRPEPADLARIAHELNADLSQLPLATCRICALRAGTGVMEIDEYGQGKGGYGFNWEADEPPGAHLLAIVLARSWIDQQQAVRGTEQVMEPDVVMAPAVARAVLRWLDQVTAFPGVYILSPQDSTVLAQDNPPGHGMSGTQDWQWKGALFLLSCTPLQGTAMVTLAMALPPEEPLDLFMLIRIWRLLARQAADGRIAGEAVSPEQ